MNNQRFRPNNTGRPTGRVPVTRPVGRQQPQQNQQPTHSYEEERDNEQEQQQPSRLTMPPNLGFEEEFEGEEKVKSQSNRLRYILFGLIGVVVLGIIIFAGMKFLGGKDSPSVDPNKLIQGEETNQLGDGTTPSGSGGDEADASFDGNPIPVKWPADVQPTRMELQLDPNTGDPILLLVGDKSGLGTVIRSYNKSGKLSGYWVIVPDEDENSGSTNNDTEDTVTETEGESEEGDTEEGND